MKISWQWLSELINLKNISPQELAMKLTLAGFEVENITIESKINIILDVNTQTNRPDTTYLIGMTREISAIIKQPLYRINNKKHIYIKHKKIDILDVNLYYNAYLYSNINNITIKSSPKWLQNKLLNCGIKSINNLNDIINLIELKWGQCLEIFDLDKVNNYNAIAKTKYQEESRSSYQTRPSIIIDNEYNVRTFQQNNNTSIQVDRNTKNIILQITSPLLINLTISVNKQEINRKSYDLLNAFSEAIFLIKYFCEGKIIQAIYLKNSKIRYKPYIITENYIHNALGFKHKPIKILGISRQRIPKQDIIHILTNLNCQVNNQCIKWSVQIPSYRSQDLIRDIDIIEEISRVYGFDKLIDKIPIFKNKGIKSKKHLKINQIRYILRSIGLTETIHYSMRKVAIDNLTIYNPLIKDHKYLRNNLINNLIEVNQSNIKQGNDPIEIFEIGRIFVKSNNSYSENMHLSGLMGGKECFRSEWSHKPIKLTWFQAKGDIEEFFERLQVHIIWKKPKDDYIIYNITKHFFNQNKVAGLYKEKQPIGIFGQLDLKLCKKLNMPKNTYAFEIELKYLIETKNKNSYYFINYSKYPYMIRDITVSTDQCIEIQTLLYNITKKLDPLVESINIFDSYSMKKNNTQINHLSFRVKYRSKINTLTNEIVENLNKQVESLIKENL